MVIYSLLTLEKVYIACQSRKFGESGNLLDVMKQHANYGEDWFVAATYTSAKVWVAHLNLQF
jgi:hypothetical protein